MRLAFVVGIACNMLICAVVFAPWALSRETISGLLGRWRSAETGWKCATGTLLGAVVNALHFWEADHCGATYRLERQARSVLYPDE